jgi:hypothetical protein
LPAWVQSSPEELKDNGDATEKTLLRVRSPGYFTINAPVAQKGHAGPLAPAGRGAFRAAAHVVEDPVSPADLPATILRALGVDPHATVADGEGRVYAASEGEVIGALLA